jgi:hypothetical protein
MATKKSGKPALKVVSSSSTFSVSEPPRKLGQYGLNIWRSVMSEYDISDRGGLEWHCAA